MIVQRRIDYAEIQHQHPIYGAYRATLLFCYTSTLSHKFFG